MTGDDYEYFTRGLKVAHVTSSHILPFSVIIGKNNDDMEDSTYFIDTQLMFVCLLLQCEYLCHCLCNFLSFFAFFFA